MSSAPLPIAAHAAAAAGGGLPPAAPLAAQVPPTEFSWKDISGKVNKISLAGFDQDTTIVVRKGPLKKQIVKELGIIPGLILARKLGTNTDIVISGGHVDLYPKRALADSDKKFIRNGGIVVPKEHALPYTKLLLHRYGVLLDQGTWDEPSPATKHRYASSKSAQKIWKEQTEEKTVGKKRARPESQ
jgi:hypothetical protein